MWRKREVEKGRFFRTKVVIPMKVRLVDLVTGRGLTSWIEASTRELAENGFVIGVNRVMVEGFHIFTDAMKEGRGVELEWELPAEGGRVKGKGRVLWFKITPGGSSHPFEAGVLMLEMGKEERDRWLQFTKGLPE